MRIAILSDLHFEFHRDEGKSFVESLYSDDVDVLILAGDICKSTQIENSLKLFCAKYKNVIYVLGNHEHYESSFDDVNRLLSEIKISNLHILNRDSVTIDGQRFIGCTLWFRDDPLNFKYAQHMADFYEIRKFRDFVYEENRLNLEFLSKEIQSGDIVVTHHLPSDVSIAPPFRNSGLNRFFVCNCSDLILDREPKIWVHGHTHHCVDTMLGNTRIVCNPFGYMNYELNEGFNENLRIEA